MVAHAYLMWSGCRKGIVSLCTYNLKLVDAIDGDDPVIRSNINITVVGR